MKLKLLCLLQVLLIQGQRVLSYGNKVKVPFVLDQSPSRAHILEVNDDSLLQMLQRAFADEPDVVVIRGEDEDSCVVKHYAPLKQDLSCLIPPPVAPTRKESLFDCGAADHEEVLEWSNGMVFSFRTLEGNLTDIGDYIKRTFKEEALFSLLPLESSSQCDVITAEEAMIRFRTDYWYKQKPVVIQDYRKPAMCKESLKHILEEASEDVVGCKLSDTSEFEGVEEMALWTDEGSVDDIPDIVKEKLASLDLVVVRAAHEQLKIEEVLSLLAEKRTTGSLITAYVEYHRLRPDRDTDRRILEGLLGVPATNLLATFLEELFARDGDMKGHPYLWLGDGTTKGMRHFDPYDNILAQVAGSKTFTLSPPASFSEGHLREAYLKSESKPRRRGNGTATFAVTRGSLASSTSLVHTTEDKDGKPLMECRVDAGSAIFVPSGWWHEVQSHTGPEISVADDAATTLNVAINFWFPPLFEKAFPCSECKRELSREYADTVKSFFNSNVNV